MKGQVAVIAGATRGCGRGIACTLGEEGAIVYCTGRSVRGKPAMANRPGDPTDWGGYYRQHIARGA
jgi:NAD(P)-dependent dehydrogenase (short-subunit alcohol dehydrogenase family)